MEAVEITLRNQINMIEAHTRIMELAMRHNSQDLSLTSTVGAERHFATIDEVLGTYNKMVESMYAHIYSEPEKNEDPA